MASKGTYAGCWLKPSSEESRRREACHHGMGEVSGALLPGDEAAVDPAEDGGRPVHGVLAMPAGTAARRHRFQQQSANHSGLDWCVANSVHSHTSASGVNTIRFCNGYETLKTGTPPNQNHTRASSAISNASQRAGRLPCTHTRTDPVSTHTPSAQRTCAPCVCPRARAQFESCSRHSSSPRHS